MPVLLLALLVSGAVACQSTSTEPIDQRELDVASESSLHEAMLAPPSAAPAAEQAALPASPSAANAQRASAPPPSAVNPEQRAPVAEPTPPPAAANPDDAGAAAQASKYPFLFLTVEQLTALIDLPPKSASKEQALDDATLLWLQEHRTQDDVDRAWRSLSFDLTRFDEAIGARLDPTWYPELFAEFESVRDNISRLIGALPASYERDRPYSDPETKIKPCLPLEDGMMRDGAAVMLNGYPCGPSVRAMVFAVLLTDLFEDRKDLLLAAAREVGYARTLGGINYPSDVRAGEQLGTALGRQIIEQAMWTTCKSALKANVDAIDRARGVTRNAPAPVDADAAVEVEVVPGVAPSKEPAVAPHSGPSATPATAPNAASPASSTSAPTQPGAASGGGVGSARKDSRSPR